MNWLNHNTYLLASNSPRRKELMNQMGLEFECIENKVDESFPDSLNVYEIAEFLANKKAFLSTYPLKQNQVLISADTTVIYKNELLEKPLDLQDAFRMLEKLSGTIHDVVTGVAIRTKDNQSSFSVKTSVEFANLTSEEIDYYLNTAPPLDKAGGYGIQDWIGLCRVKQIQGSYTNIVGLPTHELYEALINL